MSPLHPPSGPQLAKGEQICKTNQRRSLIWLPKEGGPPPPGPHGASQRCSCVAVGVGLRREAGGDRALAEPAPLLHRMCSACTRQVAGATGTRRTPPRPPGHPLSCRPFPSGAACTSTAGPRRLCERHPHNKDPSSPLVPWLPARVTVCVLVCLSARRRFGRLCLPWVGRHRNSEPESHGQVVCEPRQGCAEYHLFHLLGGGSPVEGLPRRRPAQRAPRAPALTGLSGPVGAPL